MPIWAVTVARNYGPVATETIVHTVEARTDEEAWTKVEEAYDKRAGTVTILSVYRVRQLTCY